MDSCIYCKIIRKEIPTFIIYEDDKYISFPTIQPHKPGHILVIPKEHHDYVFTLEDEKLAELMFKAKEIATALKKAFNPPSGKVAMLTMGMGVHHVHIHLVPLEKEADMNPDNVYSASKEELEETARKVKEALV